MYEIHCTRCETTEETPTLYEPVHCKHCGDLLLAPPPGWQQCASAQSESQRLARIGVKPCPWCGIMPVQKHVGGDRVCLHCLKCEAIVQSTVTSDGLNAAMAHAIDVWNAIEKMIDPPEGERKENTNAD